MNETQNYGKLRMLYRIDGGILNGTELEPFMAALLVKYPHRKTRDAYIPPMKVGDKESKVWACCQPGCPKPEFAGGLDALLEHLMLHKGRLLKPWSKRSQQQSPLPAVCLPVNEWEKNTTKHPCPTNEDRRFCVHLYIEEVKASLHKQGIEVVT